MNLNRIATGTQATPLSAVRNNQAFTKEVQQRLISLGFQPGTIDGIWGNRTQTAFIAFATRNQLKADEISPRAAQILLKITPKPAPNSLQPEKPVSPAPPYASATQPLPVNLRAIAADRLIWKLDRITTSDLLARQVQQSLDAMGHYQGAIDGIWGNGTQSAYAEFSRTYKFDATELSPQAALLLLEPAVPEIPIVRPIRRLSDQDYRTVAQLIGCSVAAVRAVIEVEAAGSGFLNDGRPKILFEAHWFSDFTDGRFDNSNDDISSPVWNPDLYVGGAGEWDRLYRAVRLGREAALKSASWGLGQIMGFNYQSAGYASVEAFVCDMHQSEGKQLAAMFNFIKSNQLDQFLINQDWAGFALRYNGESYQANRYDEKLAEAHDRWSNAA